MKNYLYYLLIFLVLPACTKYLELEDQELANQAIVNSILWPDQTFSVFLTSSSSILADKATNPPMQGKLDLYEDGNLIRQFSSQLGEFSAPDIKPKSGKKYRIVVISNDREISAETTIPYPAEVKSVDTVTVNHQKNYKTTRYSIKVKDPPGEDYYRIVVMNETLLQGKDPQDKRLMRYYLNKSQKYINSEDTIFKTVYKSFDGSLHSHGGPKNDFFIFPDTYFQGEEYILQCNSTTYFNRNTDSNNAILKPVFERNVIHVQRLSKELYTYLKYLKLYNNYYATPFSEPVTVYSNVKNGAGIFAGFNDDARTTFETVYIPYLMDTIQIEDTPFYGNQ